MMSEQNRKMMNMDNTRIDWKLLSDSTNVSFECRLRIEKIRPETFGQLRLIEGIRAATLAVAAGKLY
ncbi:MAG: hypothetical protein HQK50_18580, partial [Oligoflexia bacterium]|nr:hypothetical protein [Oligoflexia bacterium]